MSCMFSPVVVSKSPKRENIFYSVSAKPPFIKDAFGTLIAELKEKRTTTERTIIFCQRKRHISVVYVCIRHASV